MAIIILAEIALTEMAGTLYLAFLILLLSGEGLCQCHSELSCGGDVVPSNNQSDCCVSQNGLSYNDTGTCRPCIGIKLIVYNIVHSR